MKDETNLNIYIIDDKTVNLECHNWHTFEYGEGSDLSNIDVLASQQYCTTLNIIVILNFCQTPKGESIVLSFRGATHNLPSFFLDVKMGSKNEDQNYKNSFWCNFTFIRRKNLCSSRFE